MNVRRSIGSFTTVLFLVVLLPGLAFSQRGLRIVKTDIPVAYKATIAVSDQVIAFGTGFNTGVEYLKPGDKQAAKVPGSENYSSKSLGVCGTKIILANTRNFTVAVFDTTDGSLKAIPEDVLRLRAITGDMHQGGGMQTSGNYAVAITDTTGSDSSAFKVIDVSGPEPKVISFEGSGEIANARAVYRQVAIDAISGKVAAAGGMDYGINIFDIDAPDSEPKRFDVKSVNGVGTMQMRFDNGKILFQTGESYARAFLLDTATGKITEMSRAIYGLAFSGDTYVYFASRDSNDNHGIIARAAVGKAGGQPKFSAGATGVGGSRNNGTVGFGSSAAVTSDGKRVFIAGTDAVGRTERFQLLGGSKFVLQPDRGNRPAFLLGSDVVASTKVVAFKTGTDNNTTLGYILL
ncbi:MAG: hypothetical protein DWQ47_04325 [Acidobacteria bacterium]|nr:MAG: hypothetical protein DWQ32_07875 [Acidobacteriota bacterium]REK01618.1 MAG: hypothetical protein DWQ38_04310 [Acidobacteriota bacterium]REK14574.1 MAG: hypothetical protein DWQ43_13565 [Acidobacteriota bacterium]REK45289.1 MAG: hypothetical protein DWQ47_04325 [Acidobacteriota bacterium]